VGYLSCHSEHIHFIQCKLREESRTEQNEILRGACPEYVEGLKMTMNRLQISNYERPIRIKYLLNIKI